MQNQAELFQMSKLQFLLIFVLFFSLLFSSSVYFLVDEVYIFVPRKYFEPEIQKEFGFRSENQTFYYGTQRISVFTLTKIEKDGLMDKSGFRVKDIPELNIGCRFFLLNKSNEAIFFGILMSMKEGHKRKFEVVNADDFA